PFQVGLETARQGRLGRLGWRLWRDIAERLVIEVARGERSLTVVIGVQRDADLLEVILAAHPVRSLSHTLDRGQEQADEDGDNGDYHQQLDQCERSPDWGSTEGHESLLPDTQGGLAGDQPATGPNKCANFSVYIIR